MYSYSFTILLPNPYTQSQKSIGIKLNFWILKKVSLLIHVLIINSTPLFQQTKVTNKWQNTLSLNPLDSRIFSKIHWYKIKLLNFGESFPIYSCVNNKQYTIIPANKVNKQMAKHSLPKPSQTGEYSFRVLTDVRKIGGGTVHGGAGPDNYAAISRNLHQHMVVQEVQSAVQRRYGQVGGPLQVHIYRRYDALARHLPPLCSAAVVAD